MIEMMPKLNITSNEPLYIQLYSYIRDEISSNRIEKGTKLPSIRSLAEHLNISKITVDNAYQQLIVEGYIESKPKSGMYVLEIEKDFLPTSKIEGISYKIKQISPSYKYDFNLSIDIEGFDFKIWRKLSTQLLDSSSGELLQYGDKQGEWELREQITKYLRDSRGVLCTPDQIVITAGTQNSLQLICQLTNYGDKSIAVENPGWPTARLVFKNNGFNIKSVSLDDHGVSLDHLKKSNAKLLYVTPSHQYPTGIVMPITRRLKLLQWSRNTGSFIIEDDYNSEFRYGGKPIPALQGLDDSSHVIYLGTFSRSLAPSLRISYMVLPTDLLEKYKKNMLFYTQSVSRINQKILQLFMENGYWERHIRKMRVIYRKKYMAIMQALKNNMGENARIIGGNAGLHLILEIRNGMTEDILISEANKVGVQVYPVSKHWTNPEHIKYPAVILGFGGMSIGQIHDGIKLLSIAWSNKV